MVLLTSAQVAERLGVHVKTVRRLVARGELTAVRPTPRQLRFEPADVDLFIAARRSEAVA